ncbi:diacylglycerol/polyprenol kinase family protein [Natrarchaeobaculum sulfurireducens]|uniref:Dolichol kinase n=1 Tax=Natrarchaeobaculum sulfurireducens TaxID=2044521 RepID=A0A346PKP1_9EURY|nr:dolichol kinase [Natrarchaeobaculum sulfurireducens]AXR76409.1 Dolichol kinase [Natrarchaeobaculum sulfurireducens]AXR80086.1 Dolichol kinase [Natrarchaeobaculum sulfurireducens]
MADELKRRLVHASGAGLVALWLLADAFELGLTWAQFRLLMVVLAVGVIGLEFLRLRVGLEWWIYEKLTREYEADQFAGYGYYMVSMTIVVLLFQPAIALPAMLMLALGDPISGALSDDTLRRVKRPPVLAATAGVMLVLALPFLPPAAAVAAALGGTVADGIKVTYGEFVLDDNLTIPIYAAVAAWLVLEFVPL